MTTERPVTFRNRNGCRLFGMLYVPDAPLARRVGIVVSVNAIKYRAGTFRLHVLLARALCALGYHVFTFDPEGIGDSEGVFETKLLSAHYFDIQTGKYNNDLKDAIDFFVGECKIDSVLLSGLCGGAISVLMAAVDPRVHGLILLNLPVLVEDLKLEGRVDNVAKITSTESAGTLLKSKLARVGQLSFWRKLVNRGVNMREELALVSKAVSVMARKTAQKLRPPRAIRPALDAGKPVSDHRLFNPHFQPAFMHAMNKRKRILFLFAEHDPWTWIFKSEFQDRVLTPGNVYADRCDVTVIAGANHIFSGTASQRELTQDICDWLSLHFPAQRAAA